jgi:hypothetical protein
LPCRQLSWWCPTVISHLRASASCSIPRRPGLLGTPRCGAGQCPETELATPAASGDLACNRLRRGFSAQLKFPGAIQRRKTTQATSLVSNRWRRFARGGKQLDDSDLCGGLQLESVPEGGAPLCASVTAILEMSLNRGAVWWVWRSPCTREREAY